MCHVRENYLAFKLNQKKSLTGFSVSTSTPLPVRAFGRPQHLSFEIFFLDSASAIEYL